MIFQVCDWEYENISTHKIYPSFEFQFITVEQEIVGTKKFIKPSLLQNLSL